MRTEMAKTIDKMNAEELKEHLKGLDRDRKEAEKAMASLAERRRAEALDAVEKTAKEHGFTLADLTGSPKGRRGSGKATTKGEAKYRDPDSGQTWTGKGRPPAWIRAADEAGRPRSDFAIS